MVSIITTTYEHEKYIEETIEGVLKQQYDGPIEFIIADDHSPDSTEYVVNNYLTLNPAPPNIHVKYTRHEENKGMGLNFMWAAMRVKGKYIALCEGDDYWTDPLKLAKQVAILEENEEFGLVHTNYMVRSSGSTLKAHSPDKRFERTDENTYYVKTGDMRTCTVLLRASLLPHTIDLFHQDFMQDAVLGDRPFFLYIAKLSKLYFLNDITSVYRIGDKDSASNFSDAFKQYDYYYRVAKINYETLKFLGFKKEIYENYQVRMEYFHLFDLIKNNKNLFWKALWKQLRGGQLDFSQVQEIFSFYKRYKS